MSKLVTIEDSAGRIWTGKDVDAPNPIVEMAAILACPFIPLLPEPTKTTVEVNGQRHYGRIISRSDE